jgi:hypothetical protein
MQTSFSVIHFLFQQLDTFSFPLLASRLALGRLAARVFLSTFVSVSLPGFWPWIHVSYLTVGLFALPWLRTERDDQISI